MLSFFAGKYRAISIAITLFLVFDVSVLAMNFLISAQIAKDAVSINLAGRQRMLSQRIAKSLLELQVAVQSGGDTERPFAELQNAIELFDTTLRAFDSGGQVRGGDGQPVVLTAVSDTSGRAAIAAAYVIWRQFNAKLDPVLNGNSAARRAALPAAVAFAVSNNLELLRLMNELTSARERIAAAQAERLRIIQMTGISLALIIFFVIVFYFIRQLRLNDIAVIRDMAYTDSLTGLPNRRSFRERANQALNTARRRNQPLAVLFLDIDNFKRINDTLGHAVGDQLLQALAAQLRFAVRDSDELGRESATSVEAATGGARGGQVARLGGDEFIVLLNELRHSTDAAIVAQRILDQLAEPIKLGEHRIAVTPSIGIATFPSDGDDIDSLLKNADTAMYQAKKLGKNRYRFYPSAAA